VGARTARASRPGKPLETRLAPKTAELIYWFCTTFEAGFSGGQGEKLRDIEQGGS
jgi:hypothetical protein